MRLMSLRQTNREQQQQQPVGVKASTWVTPEEYDIMVRIKGDISLSLLIKRAIRCYINQVEKGEIKNVLEQQ